MEENVSEKIVKKLKQLLELENMRSKIYSTKYLRNVEEKINSCTEEIALRIDEEIEYYGQKIKNYEEYKNSITKSYKKEFEEIADEYERKIVNIISQMQQMQANQKNAIANCKILSNERNNFVESKEYLEYKKLKFKYKEDLDNSLTKAEFDKNLELLDNLKDPILEYNEKIKASLQEAMEYDKVIEICSEEITITQDEVFEQLNDVVSNKTKQLTIYQNNNIFSKIINKITNIFNGKKKLQAFVIDNLDKEINDVKNVVEGINENTKSKTINFIQKILDTKLKLESNIVNEEN